MYIAEKPIKAEEYILTSTGNIISRSANIQKPTSLEIPLGRCIISHGTVIRADLAPVQISKHTFVDEGTSLIPCNLQSQSNKYIPLNIGASCYIGKRCTIEAAVIGMGCVIGDDCVISKRCILKDFVRVEAGSHIAPDTVLPPFAVVSGNPAVIVGELPESSSTLIPRECAARYKSYKPIKSS
jgi:dynactin-5